MRQSLRQPLVASAVDRLAVYYVRQRRNLTDAERGFRRGHLDALHDIRSRLQLDTQLQRLIGFDLESGNPEFQKTRGIDDDRCFSRGNVADGETADGGGDGAQRPILNLNNRAGDGGPPRALDDDTPDAASGSILREGHRSVKRRRHQNPNDKVER